MAEIGASPCDSWLQWGVSAGGLGLAAGLVLKLGTVLRYRATLVFLGDINLRKLIAFLLVSLVILSATTAGKHSVSLYQMVAGCEAEQFVETPAMDDIVNYIATSGGSMMFQAVMTINLFRSYVIRNYREYAGFQSRHLTVRFSVYVAMVVAALLNGFIAFLEQDEMTTSIILTIFSSLIFFSCFFLHKMTELSMGDLNEAVNVAEVADRKTEIVINERLLRLLSAPSLCFLLLSFVKFVLAAKGDLFLPDALLSTYDVFLPSALLFLARLCMLSHLRHPRFRYLSRVAFVTPSTLPSGMRCMVDKQVQTETQMVDGVAITVEAEEPPTTPLMSLAGRAHHTLYACLLENSWISKMRVKEGLANERKRWEAAVRADYARIEQEARFYKMYQDCRVAALKASNYYNARAGEIMVCV